ncbi:MAG: phospholipase D-like domain-containing protein [Candidatus Thermoplasmatota archaeon]
MRVLGRAAVSSALLFVLAAWGLHPASGSADAQAPPLAVAEFYPCAVGGDEYLVLSSRGAEAVNLMGWTVSDGEGSIALLGGLLRPGEALSISENASSFERAYGTAPDLHLPSWTSGDGADVTGTFRLADSGDALELRSPDGSMADAVAYGECPVPSSGWVGDPIPALRQGEVARRIHVPVLQDTDTSADWTPFREHRYGYSSHPVVSSAVPAGCVRCFTSPDCSLDVVLEAISGASSQLRVCSYELSSSPVCVALLAAASRGVDVRVLVDSQPVGGMSQAQVACLSSLARGGAEVRVLGGDMADGEVRHVGALHAKYIVVDGDTLVALSENLVEDGVPTDRLFGNRGWGVAVEDASIASHMSAVFDDDSRTERTDVWLWTEDPRCDPHAGLPEAPRCEHPEGMMGPGVSSGDAVVSLFLSPDASMASPFLAEVLSDADDVSFEQFQAELEWDTRWSGEPLMNPVVEAVADVMRGGGSARGLMDGLWYNAEGNGAVADYLSSVALSCGLPPSFGLLAEESPVTVLHNKGLVSGDRAVVSSNNWVYASFARNRELALVVDGGGVSEYFSAAFELDRVPDTSAPLADAGPDMVLEAPGAVVLDASASSDDRALANFSWDLDGDGRADAWGESVSAQIAYATEAALTVRDAWGNTASDTVAVAMDAPGQPPHDPPVTPAAVPWPLPAVVSLAIVALAAARKLNLSRQSTRPKG